MNTFVHQNIFTKMKKHNLFKFILLAFLIIACSDAKKLFTINKKQLKANYKSTETVILEIDNPSNNIIDSVLYTINNVKVANSKANKPVSILLKNQKLGIQNIAANIYYEGKIETDSTTIEIISDVNPKAISFEIVNIFKHDSLSFTEGLEFYKDTLYESTGLKNLSYIRKYDYKTAKVYKQIEVDKQYFGEGITLLKNKMYHLTWQDKTGFIYDAGSFKKLKSFTYDKPIEGWGMTNDGENIYQTDGTEKIWKMNPDTQKMIDFQNVYAGAAKIDSLNELELINNKLFANIWQKDAIAIINPATGKVEGILNLAELRKKIKNKSAEVLNGIAYNPKTKTVFITGKNWDSLFEIRIIGLD